MNIVSDRIAFTLISVENFADRSFAELIVGKLLSVQSPLTPTTYGAFEPPSLKVIAEESKAIVDVWLNADSGRADAGSVVFGREEVAEYQVAWQRSADPFFPFIGGSVQSTLLMKEPELLTAYFELIKELAHTMKAIYGEVRNLAYPGWGFPLDLRVRLPDIPWASIYGAPYVRYFGNDRISTAPFNARAEISTDMFWLEATASVFDPVPEETKSAIRHHLGEESFMSSGRWRYQSGKAPTLPSPSWAVQ